MMAPFLTGLTSGDVITSTLHIIKGEQTCAYSNIHSRFKYY